jgi:predicted lactoylglutathione lyase
MINESMLQGSSSREEASVPRKLFINLPVTDLGRAMSFYEAVGATNVPQFSNEHAAMMRFSDEIAVMLLTHDFYRGFTSKPIVDAHSGSAVLLAISCEDRAAVDSMVEAAARAGGIADPGPRQDHGFMYGRSFEDPDGHHWEPNWMDIAAMQPDSIALQEQEA